MYKWNPVLNMLTLQSVGIKIEVSIQILQVINLNLQRMLLNLVLLYYNNRKVALHEK